VRETVAASRTREFTTKPKGARIPPGAILPRPAMICVNCQKNDEEVTLVKCPICFKMVCHDCGRREYGRVFCGQRCSHIFFFGDDDDDE
jgi:hypothetical protein